MAPMTKKMKREVARHRKLIDVLRSHNWRRAQFQAGLIRQIIALRRCRVDKTFQELGPLPLKTAWAVQMEDIIDYYYELGENYGSFIKASNWVKSIAKLVLQPQKFTIFWEQFWA